MGGSKQKVRPSKRGKRVDNPKEERYTNFTTGNTWGRKVKERKRSSKKKKEERGGKSGDLYHYKS